jgi:hypothetical protein
VLLLGGGSIAAYFYFQQSEGQQQVAQNVPKDSRPASRPAPGETKKNSPAPGHQKKTSNPPPSSQFKAPDDKGTPPPDVPKPAADRGEPKEVEVRQPLLAPPPEGKREVKLPGEITECVPADRGRLLVLLIPSVNKLAVFDVAAGKVRGYLKAAEPVIKFAAGLKRLVVVLPQGKQLQIYNLEDLKVERTVPYPTSLGTEAIGPVCMGHASDGPLYLAAPQAKHTFMMDLNSLETKEIGWGHFNAFGGWGPVELRASADGSALAAWGGGWAGLEVALIANGRVVAVKNTYPVGPLYALPSYDGRIILTNNGIATAEGGLRATPELANARTFPAREPGVFLAHYPAGDWLAAYTTDGKPLFKFSSEGALLHAGSPAGGPAPPPQPAIGDESRSTSRPENRFHYYPTADLLAVLPQDRPDHVVLYRLDLAEALEKSGSKVLLVTSRVPVRAVKGEKTSVPLVVRTKAKGLKYQIESGTEGMTIGADGVVHWTVPADFSEASVDVIVKVSADGGLEAFHSFTLPLVDGKVGPMGKVPDPKNGPDGDARGTKVHAGPTVRELPDKVADVAVGGGGRYLVLYLPKLRQLAIFDSHEGKVVRTLPVAGDNIKFTADKDKLFVALPAEGTLQRWDLASGEREAATRLPPITGTMQGLCMGEASAGPLLLVAGNNDTGDALFLDPKTFRPLDMNWGGKEKPVLSIAARLMRASADGSVFAFRDGGGGEPHRVFTVTLRDLNAELREAWLVPSLIVPGPDGRLLYTAAGVLNAQFKPTRKELAANLGGPLLPAHGGNYVVQAEPGAVEGDATGKLSFLFLTTEQPFAHLPNVEGLFKEGISFGKLNNPLACDKRVHFIAPANLVVTIPPSNDRLLLYKFNPEQALEKSGTDYLFVVSEPPLQSTRGKNYTYQVVVKSKKGGIKYKLESGPMGMQVSPEGKVTWPVPSGLAEAEADVLLSVRDASGQEQFHSFKVAIEGKAVAAGAGPMPAMTFDLPSLPSVDIDFPQLGMDLLGVILRPDAPGMPPVRPPDMPPEPKPEVKPEVKPDTQSTPTTGLKPAPVVGKDPLIKKLPSTIEDVAVGGGGRYLVLSMPKDRKLAVFDICEGKVAHYVSVGADNVKFTAGMSKLLVALPDQNQLRRYDLATGKLEASGASPVKGKVGGLFMGSSATVPMLILYDAGLGMGNWAGMVVDARNSREITLHFKDNRTPELGGDPFVRVSADGNTFGLWRPNLSPQGIQSMTVMNHADAEVHYMHDSAGHIFPGPDGRLLFTAKGLFTRQCKRVGDAKNDLYVLPAVHSKLFLSIQKLGDAQSLSVHIGTDLQPLAPLPDVEVPPLDAQGLDSFGVDKRLHLIPAAKALVVIPSTNDRVVIHRFDIEEALEASGTDYLYVMSQPPLTAKIGVPMSYQLIVKSKKGGVKYKLESGPRGMEVTEKGQVKWLPPFGAKAEAEVSIHISDASGQEVFHTFTLSVAR